MNIRKATCLILVIMLMVALLPAGHGCSRKVTTGETGVIKDEEFGNTYIDLTIEEFNSMGFTFGDSVDVSFSNGLKLSDIPYYSGYYVPVGSLLLCGYQGYPHVSIARNYGNGTWEEFSMDDSVRVTVDLREKGKYLSVQEFNAITYSDFRNEYESDEQFANFREVTGGKLRKKGFYRSASPCDNQHNRAPYANRIAEEHDIDFVINLSDNELRYASYVSDPGFNSRYYHSLYRKGKVLLLALTANYRSDIFCEKVSEAFLTMTENGGPCLIHCVEGKDRTGFVVALLLALADASPEEIIDDYMMTYDNYFGITKEGDPEKYEAIKANVLDFFYCMCEAESGTDTSLLDIKKGAESYLKRGGLSDEEIKRIEDYLVG